MKTFKIGEIWANKAGQHFRITNFDENSRYYPLETLEISGEYEGLPEFFTDSGCYFKDKPSSNYDLSIKLSD